MPARVRLTNEQVDTAKRLWKLGMCEFLIAQELGISVDMFRSRKRDQLKRLPKRKRSINSGRRGWTPSPQEIEEKCRWIQSRWSEKDRQSHR